MSNGQPSPQPETAVRVIYKEIKGGDLLKFQAQSNIDPSAGGGARDLRFPYSKFSGIFAKMFPNQRQLTRKRNKKSTTETVLVGDFYWMDNGVPKKMESQFEPPTDARGFEGRITQVNKYPPFANPPTSGGTVFLLLVQLADGTVWPSFTTESDLKSGNFNPDVAGAILDCMRAKRRRGVAVAGYLDFEANQSFCNGN